MTMRMLAALAVLAIIGRSSLLAQEPAHAQVGDPLVIQISGDLAAEYGKRTGTISKDQVPPGLRISVVATVAQQLSDDQIRIEHTSHIVRNGGLDRLVTLTATVKSTQLVTDVVPKGTAVFASPAQGSDDGQGSATEKETRTLRLDLSDLQGLKLRTWTLSEELGD